LNGSNNFIGKIRNIHSAWAILFFCLVIVFGVINSLIGLLLSGVCLTFGIVKIKKSRTAGVLITVFSSIFVFIYLILSISLVFTVWYNNALLNVEESNYQITIEDYYIFSEEKIPSLENIMNERGYDFRKTKVEEINGKMVVGSRTNIIPSNEKVSVEITEVTYKDVNDVWGVIDVFGRKLNEEYDYWVSYPPSDYSNYGEGYRFCELVKELSENEIYYIAAIYSKETSEIKLQYGTIGTPMTSGVRGNGIGPLNLERIKAEK